MTKKQFIAAAFKLGFEAKYNGKNKTMYLYPQEKHTDDEKEIADLVVVEKGEAAPGGSAKEKPAETSGENVNMTAAPEASNPVAPQTSSPLAVANQTAAVNATETPAQ